ncbi:uncharacterized protein [Argopecten irradians]|uniref:uncharacterized protein n=1 Tax=Argopecten irradians TaxID=31199 RepID=UPI00371B0A0C
MKLFDVRNQFRQQLNFNRNNINNISSEIQRRYKNVIPSQKPCSPRPGWIQERVMVSVCQPSKYPAPLDLARLVLDPRSDSRAVNRGKTLRRNLIQEKFLVMTCKPVPIQRNIVHDRLGPGTFGDVPRLPSMLDEENLIALALDFQSLDEARRLRPSVLIEPWMFGLSCSPQQRDEEARESVLIEPWMFGLCCSPRQRDEEGRSSVLIEPWMFSPSFSPRHRDEEGSQSVLIEPWMFSPSFSPRQVNITPEISDETSVVYSEGSSLVGVDSITSLSAAISVLSTSPYSVITTPRSSPSSRSSIVLSSSSMVASSSDLQYSDVESYSSHRSTSASENYVITGNPHSVILTPRSSASSRSSIAILNASLVASSTEIYYSDVESSHRSTSAPGNVIAGSSHSISMAAIENELMALMDSPRVVHQQTSTSLCVLIGGMEYQYQHSHFNFSVFGNQVRTVDATIEILSSVDFLNEINPENGGLNILGSGVFGSVSSNNFSRRRK